VLWAGGVTTNEFGRTLAKRTEAQTDRIGRIPVTPQLTIPNFPNILSLVTWRWLTTRMVSHFPEWRRWRLQGGAYAAKVIRARVEKNPEPPPFHYFNKGDMAVIGRAAAVANIFGLHLSGLLAWLVWLFIHLIYIVEFQSG